MPKNKSSTEVENDDAKDGGKKRRRREIVEPDPHDVMRRVNTILTGDPDTMRLIDAWQQVLDNHRGPTCQITLAAFLIAAVTAFYVRGDRLFCTRIYQLLKGAPPELRDQWGLTRGTGVTYRKVHHLKQRLFNTGHLVDVGTELHTWDNIDDTQVHGTLAALQALADRLLDATRRSADGCRMSRSASVDSTTLETWARVQFEGEGNDRNSFTLDRECKQAHMPGKNGKRKTIVHGYDCHTTVQTREMHGPHVIPLLLRVSVQAGNTGYAAAGRNMIRSLNHAGHAIDDVQADMGYTNKEASEFVYPLEGDGIALTLDIPDRKTPVDTYQGAVIVDGDMFCPCAPFQTGLSRYRLGIPDAERVELRRRYDLRAEHRFTRRGTAENGGPRLECPARAGKVRCPLHPPSMRGPSDRPDTRPIIVNPPTDPGPACTQATVTPGRKRLGKFRQRHPYGTTLHQKSKARRSAVERGNAALKTQYGSLKRLAIRCFGLRNHQLFVSLLAVAVNLQIIDAHMELHGT